MFWCVVFNRGSKTYRFRAKAILRYHASQTLHNLQEIPVCNAGYGELMILVEIRRTFFCIELFQTMIENICCGASMVPKQSVATCTCYVSMSAIIALEVYFLQKENYN